MLETTNLMNNQNYILGKKEKNLAFTKFIYSNNIFKSIIGVYFILGVYIFYFSVYYLVEEPGYSLFFVIPLFFLITKIMVLVKTKNNFDIENDLYSDNLIIEFISIFIVFTGIILLSFFYENLFILFLIGIYMVINMLILNMLGIMGTNGRNNKNNGINLITFLILSIRLELNYIITKIIVLLEYKKYNIIKIKYNKRTFLSRFDVFANKNIENTFYKIKTKNNNI